VLQLGTDFLATPSFTYDKYMACIVADSVDTYLDVKKCPKFFS